MGGERKLRLGVIGAGSWAVSSHLPNFAARKADVEFVGVARHGSELLAKVQREFGFAAASEDYRDMLAEGVDICLVASPTGLHHEHAKAAMEAGAHVLVEKPFTIDAADAWDLVETAVRTRRHLVVAFGWNYKPMVREHEAAVRGAWRGRDRAVLDTDGVGDPRAAVEHRRLPGRRARHGAGEPHVDRQATVGRRLWAGAAEPRPRSRALAHGAARATAFALMSAPHGAPVELHDAIAIRYREGAIGTLSGGSCHEGANDNKHQLEFRAIGSRGQVHVDVERELGWLWRGRRQGGLRLDVSPGDGDYDCDGPPQPSWTSRSASTDNQSPGSSRRGRSSSSTRPTAAPRAAARAGCVSWNLGAGLEGKAVVVTGAAGAIGREVAHAFAAAGARVAAMDLREHELTDVVAGLDSGGPHVALPADLRDLDATLEMLARARAELGSLDVLAHVAAVIVRRDDVTDVTPEDWELQDEVNLRATFFLNRAAAEAMREQGRGGRIVNFSSQGWWTGGYGGSVAYAATKGGVVSLARGLARTYGPDGITVNCVSPGAVDTPMLRDGMTDAALEAFRAQIPLGRFGQAREIAGAVVFLASEHASYVTGATLNVSGGQLMY